MRVKFRLPFFFLCQNFGLCCTFLNEYFLAWTKPLLNCKVDKNRDEEWYGNPPPYFFPTIIHISPPMITMRKKREQKSVKWDCSSSVGGRDFAVGVASHQLSVKGHRSQLEILIFTIKHDQFLCEGYYSLIEIFIPRVHNILN